MLNIKLNKPKLRKKMAAFDYDHTIVEPKDCRPFSKDISDWQWTYDNVPNILISYYTNGYMIVIFTNQSKEWKVHQIQNVLESLNIPIFIVIARDKELYKPNILLYNFLVDKYEINKKKSFFIGDALGRKASENRKKDFSDSDKVFAENIGISIKPPEDIFKNNTIEELDIEISDIEIPIVNEREIIIMVGMPASGKSTLSTKLFANKDNYIILHGDIYKTSKKMINISTKLNQEKHKSIVYDATNGTKIKRKEYIDFAKENGYSIRCIYLTTSFEECIKRNKKREKSVPSIVYNIYKKHFETPTEDEGFTLITI